MQNTGNNGRQKIELIEKYIHNNCTKEELDQLLALIENDKEAEELSPAMKKYWEELAAQKNITETELDEKFSSLMEEARQTVPVISIAASSKKSNRFFLYAAAAVIICLLSAGVYFLLKQDQRKENITAAENNKKADDIKPGGNKAILTLADGSTIFLDQAQNGKLTTQGNSTILKQNGMVSYNTLKNKSTEILYNTFSTPRGGQYQLMLADGSKVWLNAASSLRFPASFVGKERKVELLGEAYFEVAKNASMPFKVKVNGMEVEVLGTHFNVNSYDDESSIRTTLLEGSIKINKNNTHTLLKPGEQARLSKAGDIKVIKDADVEEAVAWKDGKFQFDRADIHAVMRQIARWYDVEVDYKGNFTSHFGGTISRDVNLSQVLNMLHLTGKVNFSVENKKVTVMP